MKEITVRGLGYVGLTAAVHFAKAGWRVIGFDVSEKVVENLRAGTPMAGEFLEYLSADVAELVRDGRLCPTSDADIAATSQVQLVAVPSERRDVPDMSIVRDVLEELTRRGDNGGPRYDVIVESTLSPGTIDSFLAFNRFASLAVCPRRDWFADAEKNLATLERVVGGIDEVSTARAIEILSSVTPRDLLLPTSYRTAEVTKALENALLHALVMLPTELAINMHDVDVADALELAGTHWRLPQLFLGAGSGGRCVPLGPQYLQEHRGPHQLLSTALLIDKRIRMRVAEAVAQRGIKRALVMGVAYRPDFKDMGCSPGLAVAQHLRNAFGVDVTLADKMWSSEELIGLTGLPSLDNKHLALPGGFDGIVCVTPHTGWDILNHDWSGVRFFFDAQGTYRPFARFFEERGIEYTWVGRAGWLR